MSDCEHLEETRITGVLQTLDTDLFTETPYDEFDEKQDGTIVIDNRRVNINIKDFGPDSITFVIGEEGKEEREVTIQDIYEEMNDHEGIVQQDSLYSQRVLETAQILHIRLLIAYYLTPEENPQEVLTEYKKIRNEVVNEINMNRYLNMYLIKTILTNLIRADTAAASHSREDVITTLCILDLIKRDGKVLNINRWIFSPHKDIRRKGRLRRL